MRKYIEVAVNIPQITGVFHYHIPDELEQKVQEGNLVVVPFGQRVVYGVVLKIIDHPAVDDTKAVIDLVDPDIRLTSQQMQLATWMSKNMLAPLAACIGLMVPAGLLQQADVLYELVGDEEPPSSQVAQIRLWKLLKKRGALRGQQIDRVLKKMNWRAAANSLVKKGVLKKSNILPPPKVGAKHIRTVQLACSPEKVKEILPELGRKGSSALERRQRIMLALLREPGPIDVSWVYAESGGNSADLRYLSKKHLVILGESEIWRDPLHDYEIQPYTEPVLTKGQQMVWDAIHKLIATSQKGTKTKPILLHGVTGSGKLTQVSAPVSI